MEFVAFGSKTLAKAALRRNNMKEIRHLFKNFNHHEKYSKIAQNLKQDFVCICKLF